MALYAPPPAYSILVGGPRPNLMARTVNGVVWAANCVFCAAGSLKHPIRRAVAKLEMARTANGVVYDTAGNNIPSGKPPANLMARTVNGVVSATAGP